MKDKAKKNYATKIRLGYALKTLRQQKGLSVRRLSSLFDDLNFPVSIKTIYKWESDTITPDIKSLNVLSTIYNVGVETFFNERSHIQALSDSELKLISYLHTVKSFKKMVLLLAKIDEEKSVYGN
ncbi:MAG: helix-turn-helix transcriptional regulator [Lachnospiraceae bacterium]|nr:helix-turn-helix transcriptional regulator [Lachnospiraceae bacterium]